MAKILDPEEVEVEPTYAVELTQSELDFIVAFTNRVGVTGFAVKARLWDDYVPNSADKKTSYNIYHGLARKAKRTSLN